MCACGQAVKRKLKQQYKELEKNKQLQQWLEEKAARCVSPVRVPMRACGCVPVDVSLCKSVSVCVCVCARWQAQGGGG